MAKSITTDEQQKYWAIFSALNPVNGLLTGEQAGEVLAKSGLSEDKLADVWDRADIDQDGQLDFEEFCVAMRLVFDIMNGVYSEVPTTLPDFLVPGSKQHLITANSALETGLDMERPVYDNDDDNAPHLKDNFDWYMSPTDKKSYESIYSANADRRGGVKFDRLSELYGTLDIPEREIQNAWTLVNPKLSDSVGKDQTLAFLHVLNQRHNGARIPRSVPASLRATFQKSEISYSTSKYDKDGKPRNPTDAPKQFGGQYLNKLGVGARGSVKAPADNSGDIKDGDWETVRLKRELADLESQIQAAEDAEGRPSETNNGTVMVRRELEQLLAFKTAELEKLDKFNSGDGSGSLKSIQADIEMFKQQVESLTDYLQDRQKTLKELEAS